MSKSAIAKYLAKLPAERRELLEALQAVIRKNVDKAFEEVFQYGMPGWALPHSRYPAGYHCDPKQPVPFAHLASQKRHVGLYLFFLYGNADEERRFRAEWVAAGKRLDMGKSCVRVKTLDDVPLAVVGRAFKRMTAKRFLDHYEAALAQSGKGAKGKAAKAKKATGKTAKATTAKTTTGKASAKKATAKKAVRKAVAKKATAKKATAKKTVRKAVAKKATAKKAVRKAVAKKATAKKAVRKAVAKKAARKTATKATAKKTARKATAKATVKKTAKKTAARPSADERIAQMSLASFYPHYLTKVAKKGRTEQDLETVLTWLTGFTKARLRSHIKKKTTLQAFFADAKLNPKASLITGVICGHRVEDIQNPLTQKARYMDKLVDELARGKAMESILRS